MQMIARRWEMTQSSKKANLITGAVASTVTLEPEGSGFRVLFARSPLLVVCRLFTVSV